MSSFLSCIQNRDSSHLRALLHNPESKASTTEAIRELILNKGITDYSEKSDYCFIIKTIIQISPSVENLISGVNYYSGSGWSIDRHQTFGLTYEGIRNALQILEVKATVADSLQALKRVFSELKSGEKRAIVTDAGYVQGKERVDSYHAISLFVYLQDVNIKMSINDSDANSYSHQSIWQTPASLY